MRTSRTEISNMVAVCSLVLAVALPGTPSAWPEEPMVSAWDHLARTQPEALSKTPTVEREILHHLTIAQLQKYLSGTAASEILIQTGETLEQLLTRRGLTALTLSWYTIDSGGGTSSGGDFDLRGTMGQADVSQTRISGGDFDLDGGFWPLTAPSSIPCDASDTIFCDNFESGDTTGWSSSIGG